MSGYEKSAELYDLFDDKANIEFFKNYATAAGEIVDIGAGTGRIAIPLAEAGADVYCVEPSPAMRAVFEARLRDRPDIADKIILIPGKAGSFNLGRRFPAAFMSGCFDHFLDDHQRRKSLNNAHRHLESGGILIFDVYLGLLKESPLKPAGQVVDGERECRRRVASRVVGKDRMEVILEFKTFEKGKLIQRFEEKSLVGITDRKSIHRLLQASGFRIREEFGGFDGRKYAANNEVLIIEAIKQ